MRRLGLRAALLALILVALWSPAHPADRPLEQTDAKHSRELQPLRNLEDFRSVFNRDTGVPRLILLLSPT